MQDALPPVAIKVEVGNAELKQNQIDIAEGEVGNRSIDAEDQLHSYRRIHASAPTLHWLRRRLHAAVFKDLHRALPPLLYCQHPIEELIIPHLIVAANGETGVARGLLRYGMAHAQGVYEFGRGVPTTGSLELSGGRRAECQA